MASYTIPYIGQLDPANLEEYYDVDIPYNSGEIQIDLNFAHKNIDEKRLNAVKLFIEQIALFDKLNQQYIENDYADETCDTVKTYIEYHLEEMDQTELKGIVDFDKTSTSPEQQMIKALRLVRVGLYPDKDDKFAVFDYSISSDLTDQLIVVITDQAGQLDYLTMES